MLNWDVAYTDLDTAIVNWQMYKGTGELVGTIIDRIAPYVTYVLIAGIAFEILGGLMIFFGYRAKLGAVLLSIYIIGATLLFYPFWFYDGEQLTYNLILFLKNVSILGGVFLLFGGRGSSGSAIEMIEDEI